MSSAVSLPNHTFIGQALSSKRLTSIVRILSPETDNCPSSISGRERMAVENISWSICTKECCRPWRGLNPRPPGLQPDGASNWATEAGLKFVSLFGKMRVFYEILINILVCGNYARYYVWPSYILTKYCPSAKVLKLWTWRPARFPSTGMFKTYVSKIQGHIRIFFYYKTVSTNPREMSGKI